VNPSIGRYHLQERIGRGGMAEIFKAEERMEGGRKRVVAVKRMFPRLSADIEFVDMFRNEAQIASVMRHENIIKTYNLIHLGTYYYIVMEYLKGMDLEDLTAGCPKGQPVFSIPEIAFVAYGVARGLHYAHVGGDRPEQGAVVHRDVSPGNILIGRGGEVKITDFGIARVLQHASSTRPGVLKGKYEYMSPEYVQGLPFDGKSDLFSLGVVLYEMLAGENPFIALLPHDIWNRILELNPALPSTLSRLVPESMDAVVARALSKRPEERFQNGEEMAAALEPYFHDVGKKAVLEMLGKRVAEVMERDAQKAATVQQDLESFLPVEGRDPTTREVHVDELIGYVEPVDTPPPPPPPPTDSTEPMDEPAFVMTVSRADELTHLVLDTPEVDLSQEWGNQAVTLPPRLGTRLWRYRGWLVGLGACLLLLGGAGVWLNWPQAHGTLSVDADIVSEVYVDEKPYGVTPLEKIEVPVGAHKIEVRQPGGKQVRTYERTVEAKQAVSLVVNWRKKSSVRSDSPRQEESEPKVSPKSGAKPPASGSTGKKPTKGRGGKKRDTKPSDSRNAPGKTKPGRGK